ALSVSQHSLSRRYGEIVNINLVRDKASGRSRGFCFLCFEDQRSTVLAVDNLNGIKLKGRTIRVDHVANYRPPKDAEDLDDITQALRERGCGARTPPPASSSEEEEPRRKKKDKKKKKKRRRQEEEQGESSVGAAVIKQEREDPAYEKYNTETAREPKRERSSEREERDSYKRNSGKDLVQSRIRDRQEETQRDGHRERERQEESQRDRDRERQEE
ncbi:hypothetical protein FKM82_029171, partial [Ascaphus truei]